ncbi:hypothetical protein CDQ91_15055 [Sphingopyxis witflariensis]|uniref:asparagine synthase (glutamine-hydrolyzing) n=1 Tax=Sphingopyxis witflariensis TaxID=173675 RepID=A0A2D0AMD4_9SPHN|nr:hypothetical protein CDQ91_15055 [Sphingopyxis witflariensis]
MMERGLVGSFGGPALAARVAAAAARHGLARIAGFRDFHLFAGRGLAIDQRDTDGIIVGERFAGSGCDRCSSPDWGSWLSFTAPSRGHLHAARAALTGLPLYWVRCGDGLLLFSHLALALDAGLSLRLDVDFVRHLLAYNNLRTERTGIAGVQELLPGTSLSSSCVGDLFRCDVRCDWSPWPFAATAHPRGTAAHEVERMVDLCVAAWASSRPTILVELSGGLDSSIVAASLSQWGSRVAAVNVATSSPDGDERRYARAVAARLDIELAETLYSADNCDLTRPPAFPSPRPASFAVLDGIDAALGAAASAAGTASLFSGIGGDNVFALTRSVAPLLDAVRARGPGVTALRALADLARVGNVSLWRALRLSGRQWRSGTEARWPRDESYAVSGALPREAFLHPWDAGIDKVPYGKRLQVQAIRRIMDFLDRPARWYDRDVVAPLLSQPLVELCLSIPSWEWIAGGHDRAVARAAFADRLPAEVAWRRNKGRLETMCAQLFLAQRDALTELLLEGRMAREGLLDRDRIETYLARDGIEGDYDYFRLLEFVDLERWIASLPWTSGSVPSFAQRAYCADFSGSGST